MDKFPLYARIDVIESLKTAFSIGIEREQSQNEDKFDFPYVELSKDSYETFERIYKEQYDLGYQRHRNI